MTAKFDKTALHKFLRLSRSLAGQVRPEPAGRSEENDARLALHESAVVDALSVQVGGWPVDVLFLLSKCVGISVRLGEAAAAQWELLDVVRSAIRTNEGRVRPFDDEEAWRQALLHAKEALNAKWHRGSLLGGPRQEVVADAVRDLRKLGFPVRIDATGATLPNSEFRRLCQRIESRISTIGGSNFANAMLAQMQVLGNVQDGSLIHARTPQILSSARAEGHTPWHYLFCLALKDLGNPRIPNNLPSKLEEIDRLAGLLAAMIDVEPHSSYENLTVGRSTLARVLRDTLQKLRDALLRKNIELTPDYP